MGNTPEWSQSEESQEPTEAEQGHSVETDAEEREQGTGGLTRDVRAVARPEGNLELPPNVFPRGN